MAQIGNDGSSPGDPAPLVGWRSRGIPWPAVVCFHKEIAARAEQSFFSLNAKDDQSDRWSSLSDYAPEKISGSWCIQRASIVSQPFRLALDQGGQESVFLGGPCYVGWEKGDRGGWIPNWRPLFYREVEVRTEDGAYEFSPKQGRWSLSPLIYGLLSQVQADPGASLDELAERIIAKADAYRNDFEVTWAAALHKAAASVVPELASVLSRGLNAGDDPGQPTPWVLFAPTTKFSALTRYLMKDYEKLEERITASPSAIGGLRLLDAEISPYQTSAVDVLPVVPLNKLQLEAVQAVLGSRPLTVISGPPGCGKSQVVVSVLLNAWAKGTSVLFASNNNKAVDVVRERLEKFEAEFPIAVRAGNREKNNIIEVLRRTLNMAAGPAPSSTTVHPAQVRLRRDELLGERVRLQQYLDSHLPQRTSEALKTALRSYGAGKMKRAEIAQKEDELRSETALQGIPGFSPAQIEGLVGLTHRWLQSAAGHQQQFQNELAERDRLIADASMRARARDQAVSAVGLVAAQVEDWTWLTDGPQTSQLDAWECRFKSLLEEPLEVALEPYQWKEGFTRWNGCDEAVNYAKCVRSFSEEIRRVSSELAPKINSISSVKNTLREHGEKLVEFGLEERDDIRLGVLQAWSSAFAESSTRLKTIWDFLPWSAAVKLRRQLGIHERLMRDWVPLSTWQKIGTLDESGRSRLATIVETLRRWVQTRNVWKNLEAEKSEVERTLQRLRATAGSLNLENIPVEADPELWRSVTNACDVLSVQATTAAEAWRKRTASESATQRLSNLAREWKTFASGQPIKLSWASHIGRKLDLDIAAVLEEAVPERVVTLRSSYYSGALTRLRVAWGAAFEEETNRRRFLARASIFPTESDHISTVWSKAPRENPMVANANQSAWPDIGMWEIGHKALRELLVRWQNYSDKIKPTLLKEAEGETTWSISQLTKAVDLLPEQAHAKELLAQIGKNAFADWPVEDLNTTFAEVSPDRFRARLDQINAQLEKRSFEDAKAEWLERLQNDTAGIRAVDSLEKTLRRNHGELPEDDLPNFQKALPLVPIWVTTAQAAQAIPLHPELFDLVVIDEASQCTLTNLLPLLYRGKRLAIIGDAEQLPAITTIQQMEEKELAAKHNILDYLNLVGHTGNDVYKTATESLPRRRADVLQLNEHFRSNPQIIGFSNRHIYLQRLILKNDPTKTAALPVGSGVHRVHVSGAAEQGPRGRSWLNPAEGQAVLNLIAKLRATPALSDKSLGVVTPFTAHKDWLRERIEALGLSSDVLVDSAYGFQGDERDIMIFSPVVARGITSSASRWVESPPNLVNVALTRAREALFVVADFDYCLQQEGILRKLALYCRDIQLLRETSPAEVELFSWMIVQGWTPKVHPRIGDIEADFELVAESGQKIAIEVDGAVHHDGRKEADKARDAFLQAQGYRILRFPARAVLETPFEVVSVIAKSLNS